MLIRDYYLKLAQIHKILIISHIRLSILNNYEFNLGKK